MNDDERIELLSRAEELLNQLFNGDPSSAFPGKRVIWGLVAVEDPNLPTIDQHEAMMSANTQDIALLTAMFLNAGHALQQAREQFNDGGKLDG